MLEFRPPFGREQRRRYLPWFPVPVATAVRPTAWPWPVGPGRGRPFNPRLQRAGPIGGSREPSSIDLLCSAVANGDIRRAAGSTAPPGCGSPRASLTPSPGTPGRQVTSGSRAGVAARPCRLRARPISGRTAAVPRVNQTPARPVPETDRSLCWLPAGRSHRTQPAPGADKPQGMAHPEEVACGENDNEHRSGRAATARCRRGQPGRAGHSQKSSRIIRP
jgi:hypothetical protein